MAGRDEFMARWRKHFEGLSKSQGKSFGEISETIGVSLDTISYWGRTRTYKNGREQKALPDIYLTNRTAECLGVTPAYLAFGSGGRTPETAALCERLAQQINQTPRLAEWLDVFDNLKPEESDAIIAMATRQSSKVDKLNPNAQNTKELREVIADLSGMLHQVDPDADYVPAFLACVQKLQRLASPQKPEDPHAPASRAPKGRTAPDTAG